MTDAYINTFLKQCDIIVIHYKLIIQDSSSIFNKLPVLVTYTETFGMIVIEIILDQHIILNSRDP